MNLKSSGFKSGKFSYVSIQQVASFSSEEYVIWRRVQCTREC